MSLEFDIACLRAPCEPGDTISVVQLIARAKMAADQMEVLTAQRDELLAALKRIRDESMLRERDHLDRIGMGNVAREAIERVKNA